MVVVEIEEKERDDNGSERVRKSHAGWEEGGEIGEQSVKRL